MADGSGTTTFGYDDASRQTLVVFPGGKRVTYTFDDGGRRSTLLDPDGLTTTYSFDNANRLTGLINGASERTTWAYDSASRLTTLTLANNATVTYSYDSASRITGVRSAQSGGTAVSGFAYTRDNVGNPTAAALANGDLMTFTYDDNHRLTREQRSGTNAYDMTYTFDAAGNRTTKLTAGVTTTFTYNDADQLTLQNAGGTLTTFTFDQAGNNTVVNANGTRTTYTWDMADRVAGIALSGGALITMAYSATGLRRVRQDGSGTLKYLWDGQAPLMETDGDGTTIARYTCGTGVPAGGDYGPLVTQRRGNTSRFFHPNDLGTFDTLTDGDAATTDTYILDAWGVQRASTGSTTNPFRYIGALGYYTEPDLGLAYVRARWLRPATGSWLSVDPVEGEARYGYVGGRPAYNADPSGLWGCDPIECSATDYRVFWTVDRESSWRGICDSGRPGTWHKRTHESHSYWVYHECVPTGWFWHYVCKFTHTGDYRVTVREMQYCVPDPYPLPDLAGCYRTDADKGPGGCSFLLGKFVDVLHKVLPGLGPTIGPITPFLSPLFDPDQTVGECTDCVSPTYPRTCILFCKAAYVACMNAHHPSRECNAKYEHCMEICHGDILTSPWNLDYPSYSYLWPGYQDLDLGPTW